MDTFTALAEPTRRDILEMLAYNGELSASAIYDKFQATPPAISQHLKILRQANLVQVEKRAQFRYYRINPEPMQQVEDWLKKITQYWDERFTRLDKVLEVEKKKMIKSNK